MASKRKRKAKRERLHKEPVVRQIAELLETGKPTRWRFVSEARHGVRAGLCLDGMAWHVADTRAEEIVTLARHRIGLSQFPSWIDAHGEPPRERVYYFCESCGGYIDGGASRPWCGDECRMATFSRRYTQGGRYDDRARREATRIALTGKAEKLPPRSRERRCKRCDTPFIVGPKEPGQRFCTHLCATQAVRMTRLHEARPCLICATPFAPGAEAGLYCSAPCVTEATNRRHRAKRARSKVWHERTCPICESPFKARCKHSAYCGAECSAEAHRRAHRARMQAKARQREAEAPLAMAAD